jgi:hypothetical protein
MAHKGNNDFNFPIIIFTLNLFLLYANLLVYFCCTFFHAKAIMKKAVAVNTIAASETMPMSFSTALSIVL